MPGYPIIFPYHLLLRWDAAQKEFVLTDEAIIILSWCQLKNISYQVDFIGNKLYFLRCLKEILQGEEIQLKPNEVRKIDEDLIGILSKAFLGNLRVVLKKQSAFFGAHNFLINAELNEEYFEFEKIWTIDQFSAEFFEYSALLSSQNRILLKKSSSSFSNATLLISQPLFQSNFVNVMGLSQAALGLLSNLVFPVFGEARNNEQLRKSVIYINQENYLISCFIGTILPNSILCMKPLLERFRKCNSDFFSFSVAVDLKRILFSDRSNLDRRHVSILSLIEDIKYFYNLNTISNDSIEEELDSELLLALRLKCKEIKKKYTSSKPGVMVRDLILPVLRLNHALQDNIAAGLKQITETSKATQTFFSQKISSEKTSDEVASKALVDEMVKNLGNDRFNRLFENAPDKTLPYIRAKIIAANYKISDSDSLEEIKRKIGKTWLDNFMDKSQAAFMEYVFLDDGKNKKFVANFKEKLRQKKFGHLLGSSPMSKHDREDAIKKVYKQYQMEFLPSEFDEKMAHDLINRDIDSLFQNGERITPISIMKKFSLKNVKYQLSDFGYEMSDDDIVSFLKTQESAKGFFLEKESIALSTFIERMGASLVEGVFDITHFQNFLASYVDKDGKHSCYFPNVSSQTDLVVKLGKNRFKVLFEEFQTIESLKLKLSKEEYLAIFGVTGKTNLETVKFKLGEEVLLRIFEKSKELPRVIVTTAKTYTLKHEPLQPTVEILRKFSDDREMKLGAQQNIFPTSSNNDNSRSQKTANENNFSGELDSAEQLHHDMGYDSIKM